MGGKEGQKWQLSYLILQVDSIGQVSKFILLCYVSDQFVALSPFFQNKFISK